MRVYLPFDDGSAVSFDGSKFTLHNPPVEIDADLSSLSDGQAARTWRDRRGEIVKALEDAWWRQEERRRKEETRKIYGPPPPSKTEV